MARLIIIAQFFFSLGCHGAIASDNQYLDEINTIVQGSLYNAGYDNLSTLEDKLRLNSETSPNGALGLAAFFDVFNSTIFSTYHTYQPSGSFSERHLQKWIEARPGSIPAQIALAIYHKNHSVQIRKKFGREALPHSGIDPAAVHFEASKETLEKLKRSNVSHPHLHVIELQLLILQGVSEEKLLEAHASALSKFPTYYQIHYVVLDELIKRSQISGNKTAMRLLVNSFALQILNQIHGAARFEIYARLYIRLYQEHLKLRALSFEGTNFDALQTGIKKIVSRFNTKENRNIAALFSCLSGDKSSAKAYWPRTKTEIDKKVWERPVYFQACKQWLETAAEEPNL